jgi:hypothetical protein
VRPQQRIFKHDTRADNVYIVRDGKLGPEVAAIHGEPLVIPPYRWLFDARAVSQARVIALDGARLRAYCDADPSLGHALLRRFAALMAERSTPPGWRPSRSTPGRERPPSGARALRSQERLPSRRATV